MPQVFRSLVCASCNTLKISNLHTAELKESIPVSDTNKPQWHILTFIPDGPGAAADKLIERFNRAEGSALKIFAPRYVSRQTVNGRTVLRTLPLTFFYVFVHGTLDQIKRLCAMRRGFAFLLDRAGAQRYAVISDAAMKQFMTIARAYQNSLPFFSLADVDLNAGDLVEVVNGDFPGLKGHYIPTPRSRSGNIILQVDQGFATAAFNIRAADVRILEFAPGSGREYDQIDHFIPPLLESLLMFHSERPLTRPLSAKLQTFASRMSALSLHDRKLQPKLDALLAAAFHLLGRPAEASERIAKVTKSLPGVTNQWTRAMVNLILAVIIPDPELFRTGAQEVSTLSPASKNQTLIHQAYELHRPLFN